MTRATASARLHALAASFWRETHRELRRHAGDERLPYAIRVRLRSAAERAEGRTALEDQRAVVPRWDRRAIAAALPVRLSAEAEQRARRQAAERGIRVDRPVVAIEAGLRTDLCSNAEDLLAREGFQAVRLGIPPDGSLVERYVLQSSAFVVCRSAELQRAAYATHTPTLRIDARDPFTAYPIRADGLFMLATVVDLDTGRVISIDELLTERYFRNTRNCGYRSAGATDIALAVAEMIEGVRGGWSDSPAQIRFRRSVAEAGVALGGRVRHVIEWDAAGGFVGDGRLARVQAEQVP